MQPQQTELAVDTRQTADRAADATPPSPEPVPERNRPSGPEPTRYGDWERKGRCVDF